MKLVKKAYMPDAQGPAFLRAQACDKERALRAGSKEATIIMGDWRLEKPV